jgi:hypothetical protein
MFFSCTFRLADQVALTCSFAMLVFNFEKALLQKLIG